MEIAAEQSKLPELIGDVFADVGDSAVRTNDHLLAFALFRAFFPPLRICIMCATARLAGAFGGGAQTGRIILDAHYPAPGELALGLEINGAFLFQNLERARPELEPENVSLPRQKVVIHIQACHGLQVAPDDAIGDEMRDG